MQNPVALRQHLYLKPKTRPRPQTRAEQLAIELAQQLSLPLVAILPEFVQGPVLTTRLDGLSVGFVKVGKNLEPKPKQTALL